MKQVRANRRASRAVRNKIWIFPVLVLLMAGAMLLVGLFTIRSTEQMLEEPVYQFFVDQKIEYQAGTRLLPGKYGVVYSENGQRSDGDETPIYTTVGANMILPADMYWLDTATGLEWKMPALSRLRLDENGTVWCANGKKEIRLDSGFLSDGSGVFVFLDEMTLRWNGQTDRTDPFSFFALGADGQLRVYRYGAKELLCQASIGEKCVGTSVRGYQVDFTAGIYTAADGGYRLLVSDPKLLSDPFQ